jgi:hypothetical protein
MCLAQDPAQRLTQLDRENQLLRKELQNAQRLLSATPTVSAAARHLTVGTS